jgi:hypothetical protein
VGTHFVFGVGVLPANLSLIRQAKIGVIRDGLLWQFVETTKGRLEMPERYEAYINQALEAGITPLPILGGWHKLYEDGSDRPQAADPSITVLGGAMTSLAPGNGWMESFLRAGALRYLDAVSIHSYTNLGTPYARRHG